MMGPILRKAIVWRGNPSFITSLPGTHRVQEFLLTQGEMGMNLCFPEGSILKFTFFHGKCLLKIIFPWEKPFKKTFKLISSLAKGLQFLYSI